MKKLLILVAVQILIIGCQQAEREGAAGEPPVVENPMGRYRDACAEVGQTRMFQGSKRVDIFKAVGGLSSQQAVLANQLIEEPTRYTTQVMSKMKELADALNSTNVRGIAPGLMSPKCYDEALVFNSNVCMLAVLAAVEEDDPASEKTAIGELSMRFTRITSNECEKEITGSIVPTL